MNAKTYEVLKTTPRRDGSTLVMLRAGGSATWNGPGDLREGERVHVVDGKVVRGRQ
jgi:hypothetical protein